MFTTLSFNILVNWMRAVNDPVNSWRTMRRLRPAAA